MILSPQTTKVLNPREFEEFAEANAMQKEMFFWAAQKVIRKSRDKKFLNKCLNLSVMTDHENAMLGHALAAEASKRLLVLDLAFMGMWRLFWVVTNVRTRLSKFKIRIFPSKRDLAKEELRAFLRGNAR